MHFADTTTSANFEVVFSENQSSFDVIYGATSDNGLDETSGVQASATGPATTFSCGTATLANGLKVTYTCAGRGCTPAWQNEPPIANARRNPATVAVGSNLYAITGFNASPDYTAVNERFNGTSGRPWPLSPCHTRKVEERLSAPTSMCRVDSTA